MAAAAQALNTPEKAGGFIEGLVASAIVYAGTLGALDAAGAVVPASNTAGLQVAGRVETLPLKDTFAIGDTVLLKRGVFALSNSAVNALTIANIGDIVYVEDDNTVASTSTNLVKAGKLVGLDENGAWVDTRVLPQPVPVTAVTVATANGSDAGTTQALANALKTAVNALIVDVAVLAKKLS